MPTPARASKRAQAGSHRLRYSGGMHELATLSLAPPIATLALHRPEARNALSIDLLGAMHARLDELAGRADLTVLVLTGAGKAFCAGMDLKAVASPEGLAAGLPLRLLTLLAEFTLKLRRVPMVTVAAVNGAAIGGGCGLATVCDIALTHADSKMGFPEVDLGVCPAVVAPWVVRKVGAGRARHILLTGGILTGQRAFDLGLVDRVVPSLADLEGATAEVTGRLATGGPQALRATKALLNELDGSLEDAVVLRGAEVSARVLATPEAQATLRAIRNDAAGLVVASASDRVFVAGADLRSIAEWDDEQLDRYLAFGARVFGMISNLPFPTVAAINGAALGGGLELAMHCDGLVAAPSAGGKPYQVGLPEAGLGLCPGWGGTNLLPARIAPLDAIARTASGRTMGFDEAVGAGLFDAVAPAPGELMAAARAWLVQRIKGGMPRRDGAPLRWIGRTDRAPAVLEALDSGRLELPGTEAGLAVRDAVNTGLTRGWNAALETERRHLVRLRHTPEARRALEAFFARTGAKA